MADPETQALRPGPELVAGEAISFRFEVTWRSLTRSFEPTGVVALQKTAIPPARRPPPRDTEAKEWEMVLPRMKRRVAIAPVAPEPREAPPVAAPNFALGTDRMPRSRWIAYVGAPALVVAAIAVTYWNGRQPATPNESPAAMEMGSAGWVTEWASDRTGSARGRQISLYRPTISMSDYRLEFLGRIEHKSLGWVFRAADGRNYYVGKLEAVRPGNASPLAITHFAVIGGVEGSHVQRVLAHAPGDMLRVRLDARGSRFTVYVQNKVVED